MCGLAGIYSKVGQLPYSEEHLAEMIKQLHHRGPDGYGFYTDERIGLSHSRLSIIDLEGGKQPIHNEDQSVWVVFNGEIFNYKELRQHLEALGHQFYTHSDTETIVHLYEQYGDNFVDHLNGQFAIALWDKPKNRLVLVRDRVGIHPLFYTEQGDQLLFASETKAFLPILNNPPQIDPKSLDQVMTFWSTVGARTIFSDIFQVRPGEMLVFEGAKKQSRRYWDWGFPEKGEAFNRSKADLIEELRIRLTSAIEIRLRADVPVGAYLSGGLDSSALTALTKPMIENLNTFSIGFQDEQLDEGEYQNEVIEFLKTQHSYLLCQNDQIAENFNKAVWHAESPILRTAPTPMMMLSNMVRDKQYKVVLTGEGADEIFGGYDIFKEGKIRQFWARNPASKFRPLLLKRLYPYLNLSNSGSGAFLQGFFGQGLDQKNSPFFSHIPRWLTTSGCKQFFSDDLKEQLKDSDPIAEFKAEMPDAIDSWDYFNQAQYVEAKSLLSGYLLCSQGDRMLMANSVEGRFPFLDHNMIEFANSIDPRMKMHVLNEKYILKQAMSGKLPASIVKRFKQPYRAPDAAAFQAGGCPSYVKELLAENEIADSGFFHPKKVQMLVKKVESGRPTSYKDNMAFVGILSTQLLHNQFTKKSNNL